MSPALTGISPKEKHQTHLNLSFPSKDVAAQPAVLAVTPRRMRPVLKGKLKRVRKEDGETVVWEGCWSMREEDLQVSNPGEELDKFHYERTKVVNEKDGGEDDLVKEAVFSGYFFLRKPVNGSASPRICSRKHVDKDLRFCFTPASNEKYDVHGSGQNKFGKFTLDGTFDRTSGILLVRREYLPRKLSRNRKASFIRVARELELERQRSETDIRIPNSTDIPLEEGKGKLMSLLETLMSKDTFKWFCSPVDAEKLGLLDYHQIISTPMDLGTITEKIKSSTYGTIQDVFEDVQLTFQNAIHYNPRGHAVYRKATDLLEWFKDEFESAFEQDAPRVKGKQEEVAAIPSAISRIGKRTRVPKVTFVPDASPILKRKRSTSALEVKRKRSPESSPRPRRKSTSQRHLNDDSESELKKLREQVRKLSNHLTRMGSAVMESTMIGGADTKPKPQPKPAKKEKVFTFDEKQQLGSDIHRLPGNKIARIIEIIQSNGDKLLQNEDGEVELDIDSLQNSTLRKLKTYVARHRPK